MPIQLWSISQDLVAQNHLDLSSNQGDSVQRDPAILTRVVWALTLGIIAIILLMGGGLSALQTSVIVTGLPFALIAFIAARNLYEKLKIESS